MLHRPKRPPKRNRGSSAPRFEALEPRLLLATWSGTLAGDTTFGTTPGEVEEITGDLTVPVGVTLNILPGTAVKLRPNTDLIVRGAVTGPGTVASPITITSVKDDSVGGDTNGDGAATLPAAGDWGGIQLVAATASVDLDNTIIRFGGTASSPVRQTGGMLNLDGVEVSSASQTAVFIANGNATLVGTKIRNANGFGLDINDTSGGTGTITLTNTAIENASSGPYKIHPSINFTATGTTSTGSGRDNAIFVDLTNIDDNLVWQENLTYFVDDGLNILAGASLQIAPGTVVKMDDSTTITVSGQLTAPNSGANPTIFTSVKDDSVGGDTNADGAATVPAAGNWRQFNIGGTTNLDHVEIRYAGGGATPTLNIGAGNLTVTDSLVMDVASIGAFIASATATANLSGTTFRNVAGIGVNVTLVNDTLVDLRGVTIENATGVAVQVRPNSRFDLTGAMFTNTARAGAVRFDTAGAVTGTRSWSGGFTYLFENDLTVGTNGDLTIGAGAVLKFAQFKGIQIDGKLTAVSTAADPIVFTSLKDDTGGDTNEDGNASAPAAGDWSNIWVRDSFGLGPNPPGIADATFEHIEVRYAGLKLGAGRPGIQVTNSSTLDLSNALLHDLFDLGFRVDFANGSNVTVNGLTIRDVALEALRFESGNNDLDNVHVENVGGDALVLGSTDFNSRLGFAMDNFTMTNVLGLAGTRLIGSGPSGNVFRGITIGQTELVVLESPLQVQTGGSLTILPGTTVKVMPRENVFLDNLRWIRATGGPINADGTADRPIRFTSLLDDSVFGDTNGDGSATVATTGDWSGIVFDRASSLSHAEIRFAGEGTGAGVLMESGSGSFNLTNLMIHDVAGDAVVHRGTDLTLANSLLYNFTDAGIELGATAINLSNNTIHGGQRGVNFLGGASGSISNNSFTGASDAGLRVFSSSPVTIASRHNNLFNPAATNGNVHRAFGTLTITDQTGDISADPRYADPVGGGPAGFELGGNSPLIDAGDGGAAPPLDLVGRARFDDVAIVDAGTGTPTFADIGALERQISSEPTLNPDLVVVTGSITVNPSNPFTPGQSLDVSWQVTNAGGERATANWVDALYWSRDTVWDINDAPLGERPHVGGLDPDETYTASAVVSVPAVIPGNYHLIVRTDFRNQQAEFIESNNAGVSAARDVELATLPLDGFTPATLTDDTPTAYFQIEVTESLDQDVEISFGVAVPSGQAAQSLVGDQSIAPPARRAELMVRRGALPTALAHDFRAVTSGSEIPTLQVPLNEPGTWFVSIFLESPPPGTDNVEVVTRLLELEIAGVHPDQGGNVGTSTIAIDGAQFTADAQVCLRRDDAVELAAVTTLRRGPSRVLATFDLAGAELGHYDVLVKTDSGTAVATDAFEVIGVPNFDPNAQPTVRVVAPEFMRFDSPVAVPITVEVENPFDFDLLSLVQFNGELADGRTAGLFRVRGSGEFRDNLLLLPGEMPGVLGPGETSVISLEYKSVGVDVSGLTREPLTSLAGSVRLDDTPIDYTSLRPDSVDHDVYAREELGPTWATAGEAIRREARRLEELGMDSADANMVLQSIYQNVTGIGDGSFRGTVVDPSTGVPAANIQVVMTSTRDNTGFSYYTTTDAGGNFSLDGMVYDQFTINLLNYDVTTGPVNVIGGQPASGLASNAVTIDAAARSPAIIHAEQTGNEPVDASPVVEVDGPDFNQFVSPELLDVEGTPHLIFIRNGQIYHTTHNGTGWNPAVPIPGAGGENAKLVYSPELLGGQPGLAVFFQQTGGSIPAGPNEAPIDPNDIRIMHAIARPDGSGGWEWSEAAVYANHPAGAFSNPNVIVDASGVPLVLWQAADLNNIEDDTDLYYNFRPLSADDVTFPAGTTALLLLEEDVDLGSDGVVPAGTVLAVDEAGEVLGASFVDSQDLDPNGFGSSFVHTITVRVDFVKEAKIPKFVPFLGGSNKFSVIGTLTGQANRRKAFVRGQLEVEVELFKDGKNGSSVTASAIFNGRADWFLDRRQEVCDYVFKQAKVSGLINVNWKVPFPGTYWKFNPAASAAIGLQLEGELGGEYVWAFDESATPGGAVAGQLTMGIYGSISVFDGWATGKISGTGNMELTINAKGVTVSGPRFLANAEIKVGWWKYVFNWRFPSVGSVVDSSLFALGTSFQQDGVTPEGFDITTISNLEPKLGSTSVYAVPDVSTPVLANVGGDLVDDSRAELVIGPDGKIWAIWARERGGDGSTLDNAIVYATYDGDTWSAPTEIPGISGYNRSIRATVDSDGDIIVAVANADLTGINVNTAGSVAQAAFQNTDVKYVRFSGGAWTALATVAPIAGDARSLKLSTETDGDLWATWVEESAGTGTLYVAEWDEATDAWAAPVPLASGEIKDDATLLDIGGATTVIWAQGFVEAGQNPELLETSRLYTAMFVNGDWTGPAILEMPFAELPPATAGPSAANISSTVGEVFANAGSGFFQDWGFDPPIRPPASLCNPVDEPDDPTELEPLDEEPDDPEGPFGQSSLGGRAKSTLVGSFDPNDKFGPAGFGLSRFVRGEQLFPYEIHFENDPDAGATAPALNVRITDTLSPSLDFDTFAFSQFGFGAIIVNVPAAVQNFTTFVDTQNQDGSPLRVNIGAAFDDQTGDISILFESIDPATGLPPTDPFAGFLRVEDGNGAGQGFVSYSVRPKTGLATGTEITNTAEIRFDTNDPISTPTVLLTIDVDAPMSSVMPLPAIVRTTDFMVDWTGQDAAGSGVWVYDIFASVDGGLFELWLDNMAGTSALFAGEDERSYAFYSVATDNVGHREVSPLGGQAFTRVKKSDETRPMLLGVPADLTVDATSAAGAIVTYALPTATDDVDPDPVVSCSPASGLTFPVGETTVTCTATDNAGNSESDTFTITVMPFLPGGDVTARVAGGRLMIRGDADHNRIRVEAGAAGPGSFRISGLGSTSVNGRREAALLTGVTGTVSVALADGDDTVSFDGSMTPLTLPGELRVQLGDGDDAVRIDQTTVSGTTRIDTDSGINGPQNPIRVAARARIRIPHDADTVTVASAIFRSRVVVNTGRDADLLAVDNSLFEQLVSANTGSGSDTVAIERGGDAAAVQTTFLKPVRLHTGSHADTISMGLAGQTAKSAIFADDVRVDGGQGTNVASVLGNGNTFAVPPKLISVQAIAARVDTEAPIVQLDNVAAGLTANTNIVVSGQVSDNSTRVTSLESQVDDGSYVDIPFDAIGRFSFVSNLPLDGSADGEHAIRFRATDESGNVSSPIVVSFILDSAIADAPQAVDTMRTSEPLADIGDDSAAAFALELSATGTVVRTWTGNVDTAIDAMGDIDWFQFAAPVSGTLHVAAHGSGSSQRAVRLELYESAGPADRSSLRPEDDALGSVTTTAVAGRHYLIKVEAGPGAATMDELNYRLDVDLAQFDDYLALTGIDAVHADMEFRGRGYSVAIIDTGINYNHPDLAGRVILGPDFGGHDDDPMDTVGHGTHVAGIVASANAHAPGVVPDANVIALKITPDGSLTASVSSIVAALEWVVDHRQLYNIVAVNISFGSGSVAKGSEHAQLDPLYRALADSGVFVAVAAGNSYSAGTSSEGLNFLASSHSVVAVGAVWDSDAGPAAWGTGARDLDTAADRIASFSQRSIGLDLLAPGADILNLNRLGGLIEKSGTSMAAPFVAGTATLLREAADATGSRLTASDILDLMQVNAAVIHDGDDEHDNVANTNRSFHRIDALAALSSLIARDQAADLSTGRLPTLGFNSAHASINRSPAPDRRATEAIDLLLEATL